MLRDPYCFICDNRDRADLELLIDKPIPVHACTNHPRDPYMTQGDE